MSSATPEWAKVALMMGANVNGRLVLVRQLSPESVQYDYSDVQPNLGDPLEIVLMPRELPPLTLKGTTVGVERGFYIPDHTYAVECRFEPHTPEMEEALTTLIETVVLHSYSARRRHARIAKRMKVEVICDGKRSAELVDIGRGGAALELDGVAAVGQAITVLLPQADAKAVEVSGRVVRSATDAGRSRAGVVFDRADDSRDAALDAWLLKFAVEPT